MASKLNPFHRVVGASSVKSSETLIEYSVNDGAPVIAGEMVSFQVAPQEQTFTTNVLGGGAYTESVVTHYIITVTYNVGTDGSVWERMSDRKNAGERDAISFTATTEDARSVRLNGGKANRYNDCHMLTHTGFDDASATDSNARVATATFHCPADGKVALRYFRPVQGV